MADPGDFSESGHHVLAADGLWYQIEQHPENEISGPRAQWVIITVGVLFTLILLAGLTMAALGIGEGPAPLPSPSPSISS